MVQHDVQGMIYGRGNTNAALRRDFKEHGSLGAYQFVCRYLDGDALSGVADLSHSNPACKWECGRSRGGNRAGYPECCTGLLGLALRSAPHKEIPGLGWLFRGGDSQAADGHCKHMAGSVRRAVPGSTRRGIPFCAARRTYRVVCSEEYRGRAFGLEGIGDNLGAFLGPLLTILLFISFRFNIRSIFYLAVIPGLLAFFAILLVREQPMPVTAKSKLDIGLRQFPKPYWKYLLVTGLFGLGNSSNSFLILQTKTIGASVELTILIYAGFNLVAALISYPAGSLSDRWGRRSTLLFSFLIFFVSYLGFASTRRIVLIAALFVFYGLFQGIYRAVGKAYASDLVPDRLRASGLGWYSTTVGLVALVASVIAGLLWDRIGPCGCLLLRGSVRHRGQHCIGSTDSGQREERVKVLDILGRQSSALVFTPDDSPRGILGLSRQQAPYAKTMNTTSRDVTKDSKNG